MFKGRLILVLCYHSTTIDVIPPPFLPLKQCVRIRSVDQRNILRVWLYVIINLQPLIPDKVNVFCPIGGIVNAILNIFL